MQTFSYAGKQPWHTGHSFLFCKLEMSLKSIAEHILKDILK